MKWLKAAVSGSMDCLPVDLETAELVSKTEGSLFIKPISCTSIVVRTYIF